MAKTWRTVIPSPLWEHFRDEAKWDGITTKCAFLLDVLCSSPGIQGVPLYSNVFFPELKLSCSLIFSTQWPSLLIPPYSFCISTLIPSVFKNQGKIKPGWEGRILINDEIKITIKFLVSLGMISGSFGYLLYHFVYLTILYSASFDFICAWQCIKTWNFYYRVKGFCLILANSGLDPFLILDSWGSNTGCEEFAAWHCGCYEMQCTCRCSKTSHRIIESLWLENTSTVM